ncbi:MAG: hypothetical protein HOW97_04400 [Catenulispora sp.]|nr:hypothetical protein [Catenulispora sp.]
MAMRNNNPIAAKRGTTRRIAVATATAFAVAVGLAVAVAPAAKANGTIGFGNRFAGVEKAFVDANGHLRTQLSNTTVVDTGHVLPANSTSGVSIASAVDGTFLAVFPDGDNGNVLSYDANNTFGTITSTTGLPVTVDANTSPAVASADGFTSMTFVQGTSVYELANFGPHPNQLFSFGTALAGTSPATTVLPAGGFITTWVNTSGLLQWTNGTNGAILNNFLVPRGSSPTITSDGSHWTIDVVDNGSRLWQLTDASPQTPIQLDVSVRFGSVSSSSLLDTSTITAFADTSNNLWIQGLFGGTKLTARNTNLKVQPGTTPAVTGGGDDGWIVEFESQTNQHMVSFGNNSLTPTDSGVLVDSARSAAVTDLVRASSTPPPPPGGTSPSTAFMNLTEQPVVSGPIPYAGTFAGPTTGTLLSITYPSAGHAFTSIELLKAGHTSAECDDPNAVVVLNPGQTTTASDILAIAGVAAPTFTMARPLSLVGCFIGTPTPSFFSVQLSVQF